MSKSTPSIKINPSKNAELEFEVVVKGSNDNSPPDVRFVIEDTSYDRLFKCTRTKKDNQWQVKLPILHDLSDESYTFRVEVVVDGYFFTPATGSMALIRDPDVKFTSPSTPPSVTTSFTVKQVEDGSTKVEEAVGGPDVTGQYAPTNQLLTPEYEPPSTHVEVPDEETQLSDLGRPVPGQSPVGEPEGDTEFDPRSVAERIIQDNVGRVRAPEKKGSLFARDKAGKPIIKGIDSPDLAKAKQEKSNRVRDILKTT